MRETLTGDSSAASNCPALSEIKCSDLVLTYRRKFSKITIFKKSDIRFYLRFFHASLIVCMKHTYCIVHALVTVSENEESSHYL